jgi:hypothetical protein
VQIGGIWSGFGTLHEANVLRTYWDRDACLLRSCCMCSAHQPISCVLVAC